jgi:hypothetical protein
VLSHHEQEIWDRIVREHETETDEDLPAVVIGGGGSAILLVLLGVPVAGAILGTATGLVWLSWRLLSRPGRSVAAERQAARGRPSRRRVGPATPALADPRAGWEHR